MFKGLGGQSAASTMPAPIPHGTPAAETTIDVALVRRLLASQYPELSELPLEESEAGWDNAMFRLGSQWAVRLPRRALAAELLDREQRWLPTLAPRLPIAVPAPPRVGQPGEGYPWGWSVLPWLRGVAADAAPPAANQAEVLSGFLKALHVEAPADAPVSLVRGVPLARRRATVEERMRRLVATTTSLTPGVRRAWQRALDAPADDTPTWIRAVGPRTRLGRAVRRALARQRARRPSAACPHGRTDLEPRG